MIGYIGGLFRLPAGVRRFLATEALYGLGIGLYSFVLNLHLLAEGLRPEQVGAIASGGILTMGAAAIPVSLLADRLGRKRLLVAGIALIACGNGLYAFGSALPGFALAQAVVSLGLTLVETTEVQLLFHYCGSRREELRAYSLMFAVFTAFTGAGTLAAGRLGELSVAAGEHYRLPLLVAGGVLAVQALLRGVLLPREREAARKRSRQAATAHGEAAPVRGTAAAAKAAQESAAQESAAQESAKPDRGPAAAHSGRPRLPGAKLWLFALLTAMIGGALALVGSFLNVIVKDRLVWGDERVSLLLAANGFVLFAASLLTPWLQERYGGARAAAVVFAFNAAAAALLFASLPVPVFAAVLLLRGGGATMLSNLMDSRLMSAVADGERNLYAGMRAVLRSAGTSAATYAAGWVLAQRDYRLPFLLSAALLLVCWLFYARFVRPLTEREQEAAR